MILHHLLTRLRATTMVGLDLGSALLKAVELEQEDDRIRLCRCGFATVEDGGVGPALQRLVKTVNLAGSHVTLGIGSPEAVVRPFLFPAMPHADLEQAVALEAEQAMLNGHALHDMAIDWHLLPVKQRGSTSGILAVVPKSVISARLQMLRGAHLAAVVVDVDGLALWNGYWTLLGRRLVLPKTVLLANIGARTTNLVIARGPHQLMLVRDLQLGTLALGKGQAADWQDEIADSLSYAHATGGLQTLDVGYVTGGGGGPETAKLLAEVAHVETSVWNPLDYLVHDARGPAVAPTAGPLLSIAVGLALRRPS